MAAWQDWCRDFEATYGSCTFRAMSLAIDNWERMLQSTEVKYLPKPCGIVETNAQELGLPLYQEYLIAKRNLITTKWSKFLEDMQKENCKKTENFDEEDIKLAYNYAATHVGEWPPPLLTNDILDSYWFKLLFALASKFWEEEQNPNILQYGSVDINEAACSHVIELSCGYSNYYRKMRDATTAPASPREA